MKSFFHWFRGRGFTPETPWLLLGKGPSFARRHEFNLDRFRKFGLNHVALAHPVDVTHAIDIEVVEQCGDALLQNSGVVVLPWVPHVRYRPLHHLREDSFRPSSLNLAEYCERIPLLRRLDAEDRLLWYNLCTSPFAPRPGSPVITAFRFSATAGLNLLAEAGVQEVRSLGVDGGRRYSHDFKALEAKTMVLPGQLSYDIQFRAIAETIMKKKVDFAPLDVQSPAIVFVGAEPEQMLPLRLLEYSIRRRCSLSVEIVPLYQAIERAKIEIPRVENPSLKPRTPFSFQRFAIPQCAGYRGRAIYLDSDMLVLKDIRELWTWPFDGAQVLSVPEPEGTGRHSQFSVMVLDCSSLRWDVADLVRRLVAGEWTYDQFVYELAPAHALRASLPQEWNELERFQEGRTALIHFTDMDTQPWLDTSSLLGRRWSEELFSAVSDGFITRDEILEYVERGWVRPSLRYQLEHGIVDPMLLTPSVRRVDRFTFTPPHRINSPLRRVALVGKFGWMARRVYATSRHLWRLSGAGDFLRWWERP